MFKIRSIDFLQELYSPGCPVNSLRLLTTLGTLSKSFSFALCCGSISWTWSLTWFLALSGFLSYSCIASMIILLISTSKFLMLNGAWFSCTSTTGGLIRLFRFDILSRNVRWLTFFNYVVLLLLLFINSFFYFIIMKLESPVGIVASNFIFYWIPWDFYWIIV